LLLVVSSHDHCFFLNKLNPFAAESSGVVNRTVVNPWTGTDYDFEGAGGRDPCE